MVFSCNGTVTKWIFGAEDRGTGGGRSKFPELQIWRQLGSNNYNKTGFSLVNANTMIGTNTNLYEFTPQPPLEFQEGDIFGVHSPSEHDSVLVLQEQIESEQLIYELAQMLTVLLQ